MNAAHKDTPRVEWQQQSGQFLQAASHGSGLHYPENFLINISTGCSDNRHKLKYSCFTSSWFLIHLINPHATDSKAVTFVSHRHDDLRKEKPLDDINQRTHDKSFTV